MYNRIESLKLLGFHISRTLLLYINKYAFNIVIKQCKTVHELNEIEKKYIYIRKK